MYRSIILLIISVMSVPAFAERTVVTGTPYYNSYYAPQAYYGGDYVPQRKYSQNRSVFYDINDLERYAMNKNFTKDSDRIRLERLETMAFGAIQEGDIYTRYDNVRNAILSRPKQNYKTSVLRSIGDYFSGKLTGYTPSLVPTSDADYYHYPSGYEKQTYSGYSTPWGQRFNNNSYGIGSGSSVRILD